MSALCYLSLGSNLGDRMAHLKLALTEIAKLADRSAPRCSPIYATEPWGWFIQGEFLNCAVELRTAHEPPELLHHLKNIEHLAGRQTHLYRWGPRELDVDILLYGDMQLRRENLIIPHPQMMRRRFVLAPLADLAPNQVIAGLGIKVQKALEMCADPGRVTLFAESIQ